MEYILYGHSPYEVMTIKTGQKFNELLLED